MSWRTTFSVIRKQVGPDTKILAAVKANAYGHGAVECARRLESEGADWFGVALPEEEIELRDAGIRESDSMSGWVLAGPGSRVFARAADAGRLQIDMIESLNQNSAGGRRDRRCSCQSRYRDGAAGSPRR